MALADTPIYPRRHVKPETAWVHLDIAGVAWANTRKPTIPPGAVGFGVKLFDEVIAQSEGR